MSSNPFSVPGEVDLFIPFSQMSKLRFPESKVPGLVWGGAFLVCLGLIPLGRVLLLLKQRPRKPQNGLQASPALSPNLASVATSLTSHCPLPSELSPWSFQGALPLPASVPLSMLFPSLGMLVLCPLQSHFDPLVLRVLPLGSLFIPNSAGPGFFIAPISQAGKPC